MADGARAGNAESAGNGILEAHRVTEPCIENDVNSDLSILELEKVSYNTNLNAAVFDPPRTLENFDLAALVEELKKNEEALLERVGEYSFVQKETERIFDGKGAVKKETRKTYEVFPTRQGKRVLKLVSENGVSLTGEKLAREEQRVVREIEKSEKIMRRKSKNAAGKKPNWSASETATRRAKADSNDRRFSLFCESAIFIRRASNFSATAKPSFSISVPNPATNRATSSNRYFPNSPEPSGLTNRKNKSSAPKRASWTM